MKMVHFMCILSQLRMSLREVQIGLALIGGLLAWSYCEKVARQSKLLSSLRWQFLPAWDFTQQRYSKGGVACPSVMGSGCP